MEGAPATKGLMILSTVASIGTQINSGSSSGSSSSNSFSLQPAAFSRVEIPPAGSAGGVATHGGGSTTSADALLFPIRGVTNAVFSQLAFTNVGTMLFGLGLLYQFRVFERRMGTAKFVTYISLATVISISTQVLLLSIAPHTYEKFTPGPYAVIFSLFVQYFAKIPKLKKYPFRILGSSGMEFSEKSIVYLMGLQLSLIDGLASFVPSIIGFMSGILMTTPFLPLRNIEMPAWLSRFGERFLYPLFYSPPTNPAANASATDPGRARAFQQLQQQQQQQQQQRQQQQGMAGSAYGGNQREQLVGQSPFTNFVAQQAGLGMAGGFQAPPPTEEKITTLVEMGYDRELAIRALRAHANDIQRATEAILSGQQQ